MNEQELKKAEEYVKVVKVLGVSIYDHEVNEIVVDLFPALVAEVRRLNDRVKELETSTLDSVIKHLETITQNGLQVENARLRAALADVIHSPKYQTESCGRTIINLSCDISIIEEAVNALAGDK